MIMNLLYLGLGLFIGFLLSTIIYFLYLVTEKENKNREKIMLENLRKIIKERKR